jgi:hypothetical protein
MGYGYREKYLFSALNPNSGIRADLFIVVLVRLECIVDVGVDILIITLYLHLLMSAALLDWKRLATDLTRTLMRDWFHD